MSRETSGESIGQSAAPDESAGVAGNRMLRHKIGCLPVVDAAGRLAGIVTGDDFLRWATMRLLPTEATAVSVAQSGRTFASMHAADVEAMTARG